MNLPIRFGAAALAISLATLPAQAQFKEIKAAPFSSTTARQKIRTQLAAADPANREQVVSTISGWLDWYRDILDEELIARWKSDDRANVPLVMAPLADTRVAREVVLYSWRVNRPDTFTLDNAPMLEDLMARYPDSAKPMLDDLLPPAQPPQLSPSVAEALCRMLVDMPDIGVWRKNALQILPAYRAAVDPLLRQDAAGPDQEKSYRALRWRADLKLDPPPSLSQQSVSPQAGRRILRVPATNQTASASDSQRPHITGPQPSAMLGYTGPMAGTFESNGDPIPPNAEYVFTNIPPLKLLLDFDTKHWEARLAPGEGQTQVLILRNKGKNTQKKCVVRWSVMP
jgi:hypothetical protein